MLVTVVNTCDQEELEESDEDKVVLRVVRHEEARRKIAVGRVKIAIRHASIGEGIKDAISNFEDAYMEVRHRNERLPPELFNAEEAKAFLARAQSGSVPTTLADIVEPPVSPGADSVGVDTSMSSGLGPYPVP
ncbi:uncharacterized protein F5147DRAFT_779693 [Suillus discolor]|uniref:Uncharacterized protein n=1 Tax=Suillus discolor TaxID=1912936 RepID=A0A9P7JN08_9AGAM|nr:uncharacterized protein F5147DRAFT_779693 [Suillus discolor]KAG2092298.1 hypothetical protein F5147DRAFT_779693 [Suillus discolor]